MPQSPVRPHDLSALVDVLRGRPVVALVGAGCSTESGIPDYRGPQSARRPRAPMQYGQFVRDAAGRARYWARSAVGWPRVAASRPNPAHLALARLERGGVLRGVITQNVDGLHQGAGSRRVVELHGSLAWVRCLECGLSETRAGYQDRILALNPEWAELLASRAHALLSAPDGDAELPEEALRGFRVPGCEVCGGVVKPDVVFFGESVPRARVDGAWSLYEEAEVLLVLGSSLTVYSGRRFVHRAVESGLPIAVVNLGPTRADDAAAVRVDARLGEVLPRLADELLESPAVMGSPEA